LGAGVSLLRLGTLSSLLQELVLWLPNIIVAAVVIIFGVALAHFAAMKIDEHTTTKGVKFFSKLVKIVLYFIILVVALQQIGLDVSIIENTWYLLIGALAVGIAVALGVGLGGALKQEGREIVDDVKGLMKH
jgi:small-conductance mechanosensitive channel